VRRHLNPARLNFVFVAKDGAQLASALAGETGSPISYPTPKPPEVLQTDQEVEATSLPIEVGSIQIVDAQSFMEK
jgi:hypothetical protein